MPFRRASKKHHRDGIIDSSSPPRSPKSIKFLLQSFLHRNGSSKVADTRNKSPHVQQSLPPTDISPCQHQNESVVFTPNSSMRMQRQEVSSLKQARLIARGLVDEIDEHVHENLRSPLPVIPEMKTSQCLSQHTFAQLEQLKSEVQRRNLDVRRHRRRSDYNSAPPGTYWPDGIENFPYDNSLNQQQQRNIALFQAVGIHSPNNPESPQDATLCLPHYSTLRTSIQEPRHSRPASVVIPKRNYLQSPSSPGGSQSPFFQRPLPPTPLDLRKHGRVEKQTDTFWKVISPSSVSPSTSNQFTFDVVDTVVYSNVHVPVLRVSSSFSAGDVQPRVTDASPCFSMHQSEEVSASSRNHNLQQHKRHISPPIDRRRLSPHFRPSTVTSPHHAVSVSPSNSTCLMQGNTIISHHPASLFAPLPRVSLGRPTSPPAISSRVNDLPQIAPQCYSPTSVPPTVDEQTLSPSHDSPVLIKTLSADSSPPVNDIKVTFFNQPRKTSNQESTGHHNQQHRTNRKPSRQGVMQAAYEEAWDVKMTRRLGGMDVSRLTGSTMEQSKKDQEPNLSPNQFQRAAGYRASDRPRLTTTSVKAGHEKRASLSPSPSSSALKFLPTSTEMGEENGIEKFRNSSTDAVSSRELVISPFRLKHNQEKLPSSPKRQISTASELLATGLSSDYDYAYNRSWSMGVQLSLSMNLAHGSSDSSSDQAGVSTPTAAGDTPRNSFYGEEHQKTIAASPPPPPPHRSSCMTPVMTQFSPKSPQATPRGVHNPLACLPSASPTKVYEGEDGVVRTPESSTTMSTTSGVLPNSARQLADWDYTSSDSCYDEPWEIRQKRLVAQLTSGHYIDPQELVSEVAASTSKNGNCRDTNQQLLFNGNPLSNGVDVQTSAGSGATSPSFSSHLTTNSSPPPRCRSPNTSRSPPPPLPPHDLKPLHEQPWYHPNLTRIGAEELLRNSPEGSFVVRLSETIKNDFSLTVKHMGFLHMKITRDAQGFYILGEYSQPYSSIPQMISHYGSSQVPIRGATSVSLCHPR